MGPSWRGVVVEIVRAVVDVKVGEDSRVEVRRGVRRVRAALLRPRADSVGRIV